MRDPLADELWAWHDCAESRLADGSVLAWRAATDGRAILPAAAVAALRLCSRYHTLDRHVELLRQQAPGLVTDAVTMRSMLQQVADTGLLANAREAIAGLRDGCETEKSASPLTVTLCTADRPVALAALLEQLAAVGPGLAVPLRLHLLDRSLEAANLDANRQLFAASCERNGWPGLVLDAARAGRALLALHSALPDCAEAIGFLLGPIGASAMGGVAAMQNWALLLAPGQRVVLLDDGHTLQSLAASSVARAWYEGQLDLLQAWNGANAGGLSYLLGAVAAGLGGDIAGSSHAGVVDLPLAAFDGADPALLAALSGASPLLTVACGEALRAADAVAGRSLLGLSDAAWGGWLAGSDAAPDASSSQLAQYVAGYRQSALDPTMAGKLVAFDHRRFLPPALPGGMHMDQRLQLTLKAVWPDACSLALPVAVLSQAAAPMDDLENGLAASLQCTPWGVEFDALAALSSARAGLACGPERHAAALARCYEELGTQPPSLLLETQGQAATRYRVDSLCRLAGLRRRCPQAVKSRLEALGREQASLERAIAGEAIDAGAAAADAATLLRHWRACAGAIRAWPAVLAAAAAVLPESVDRVA